MDTHATQRVRDSAEVETTDRRQFEAHIMSAVRKKDSNAFLHNVREILIDG
jgi:hypothetical protein